MSKNKSQNGTSAQGVENAEKPVSLEEMREFIKRDCAVACSMLDAIYKDQNTLDALADFLYGRYLNARHKADLARQTELIPEA